MVKAFSILNDKFDMARSVLDELRQAIEVVYNTTLKVKRLHPDAKLPRYGSDGAAGMDLTATGFTLEDNIVTYSTGLSVEIPEGYVGLLFPRSSIKNLPLTLANSVGVIDSDYRGEIKVSFRIIPETSGDPYSPGDRICQLVLLKNPFISIEEVDELSDTTRGSGGFGSTGK